MIRLIATIISISLSFPLSAQIKNNGTTKLVDSAQIYTYVEKMPEFPGGNAEMMKFIGENLVYPEQAKDEGIAGKVIVSFIVQTDGSISSESIKIERSIGGGTDQELKRLVLKMPKWTPGYHDGNAVPVMFRLPVAFAMQ